jgi:hypothetical protein
MANITTNRKEFDRAEKCCQRALSCAGRYEGEKKTAILFNAYKTYIALRKLQNNFTNAVTWAEEAYNCVAEVNQSLTLNESLNVRSNLRSIY